MGEVRRLACGYHLDSYEKKKKKKQWRVSH